VAQAYHSKNPERIAEARRALATANIEAAIQRNLKKSPPLTSAEVAHLSSLLRGGAR